MVTKDEALQQAQATIKELQETLERVGEVGLTFSSVAAVEGKFAVLTDGNSYTYAINAGFKAGDTVLVHPMTGQVVQKTHAPKLGEVSVVASSKDGVVEIASKGGDTRVVNQAEFKELKQGDRVLMDPSGNVIIHVVERVALGKKAVVKPVTWADVGGHTEAKQLIREAIELPYKHPKLYQQYGKRQPKGILFYGPPGCGKTLLGRATATAIGDAGAFISVKGPEILSEWVGVAERAVRMLFAQARAFKEQSGKSAVIFIDEAESIMAARGGRHSYMEKTIVPAFLTEMDGLEDSSAMVILSTNRADMLDPAIVREGRIDHKVEIKRPDAKEAKSIFAIHLGETPIDRKYDRRGLIEFATSKLYQPSNGPTPPFSGALIEGTVNKAITAALRRDVATGRLTGLCEADFEWATQQVLQQEAYA